MNKHSENVHHAESIPQKPQNKFLQEILEAEEKYGCLVGPPQYFNHSKKEVSSDRNFVLKKSENQLIDINRLTGEILKLDREVDELATVGRLFIGQQTEKISYIFMSMINPQISGSEELYEFERMLRFMKGYTGLDEAEWKRSAKARKQWIEVMRATTELVIRRLIMNVLEQGCP